MNNNTFIMGFVKMKKFQKSEKNEKKVGGWVKPQLECFFVLFFDIVNFFFFKWIEGWEGGVWPIRVFLGFLDYF